MIRLLRTKERVFLIIAVALTLCQSSLASDKRISLFESDGYVSVLGGESFFQSTGLGYGFSAGFRILERYPSITLGGGFTSNPTSTPNRLFSYSLLISHNFSDENNGFAVGLRTGYGVRGTSRGLVVAPIAQYHYPLFDFFTVGVHVEAVSFFSSGLSESLLTQAVIQYWF